jgi:hypothetical protein
MVKYRISRQFKILEPILNKRFRRHFATAEAMTIGHGGITLVTDADGVSCGAITANRIDIRNHRKESPTPQVP